MVLFLHNRYRTSGGEEQVVEDLRELVRERLDEQTEMLSADSATLGPLRAASGLLAGGLAPAAVAAAVATGGARVVHAHNLLPAFGWRSLAAAGQAGARVVLHLHQYRLVCAIGVCFRDGRECTRCHARNTLPGVLRNCRGSRAEALAYGAALAMWQPRVLEHVDALVVPSRFAAERLRELGVVLPEQRLHVLAPPIAGDTQPARGGGGYALVVSRLSPEKGVAVAIDACRRVGMPLTVVGDGPELGVLRERAAGGDVRFLGRVTGQRLSELRAEASIAIVPSRSAETFGMALAEAMAAGVPAVASDIGALGELLEPDGLVPAGDPQALAEALARRADDRAAALRGRERALSVCSPESVASNLRAIYEGPPTLDPS